LQASQPEPYKANYVVDLPADVSLPRLPIPGPSGAMPLNTISRILSCGPAEVLDEDVQNRLVGKLGAEALECGATKIELSDSSYWLLFDKTLPVINGTAWPGAGVMGLRVSSGGLPSWLCCSSLVGAQIERKFGAYQLSHHSPYSLYPFHKDWAFKEDPPAYVDPNGTHHIWCPVEPRAFPITEQSLNVGVISKVREFCPIHGNYSEYTRTLTLMDVESLRVGDPVTFEYPFQWVKRGSALSCGSIEFPKERPVGKDWSTTAADIRFAQSFTSSEWPYFLRALRGCYASEVLPASGSGVNLSLIRERMRSLAKPQKEDVKPEGFRPENNVYCFSAREENHTRITVGKNLIFELNRSGNLAPLYLVDAPNICAVYIFEKEEDALKWAMREISFVDARALAMAWIPHNAGWQRKVDEVLRANGAMGY